MNKLPKSGYNDQSAKNFLLNAGAVVRDLKWSQTDGWTYEEFGATSGGSTLTLENALRQMEIDGVFATPVGGDVIETSDATIELNLLEFTRQNIQTALMAEFEASDGEEFPEGYDIIRPSREIKDEHYIKNLAYIGTIKGSDLPIIVIFDYAIATSGLEFSPEDNADITYSITFAARTSPVDYEDTSLPVRILVPSNNGVIEGS